MTRALDLIARSLALLLAVTVPSSWLARAADEPTKRVGFVSSFSPSSPVSKRYEQAFWDGLRELGWVDGRNIIAEVRWAEGRIDRFPALMAELVALRVDILVCSGTPAAIAAQNATSTIPIVDAIMGDPVESGIAASLARPGGNITGLSMGWSEGIAGKWLELLQEATPRLSTLAVIVNPDRAMTREQANRLEAIASTRGINVRVIGVRGPEALDRAFEEAGRTAQAVLVLADANLIIEEQRIVALAARHRLPDIYSQREFVDAGGLMAYGPDLSAMFRRAASYVDKILRGAKPGDLPVEQPTEFELVVNLKTARALRLKIPESIWLRANEVIK